MSHDSPTPPDVALRSAAAPNVALGGARCATPFWPLLAIIVAAVGVRAFVAYDAAVISPDGAPFIAYAQALGVDPLATLRANDQHPLFPALIHATHSLLGSLLPAGNRGWILSGLIVTQLAGVAAVLAMYWLTRGMYDPRRALVAAALLAFLPDACQLGGDVLSDLPHIALYLLALAAALAGLRGRRPWLLLSAALAALAFLTRPEGGAVLLILGVLLAFGVRWPWRARLGWFVACAAMFFALAGPYQLAVGKLLPKKSLWELLSGPQAAAASAPGAARPAAEVAAGRGGLILAATDFPAPVEALYQWVRGLRLVGFIFAVVGLCAARPDRLGLTLLLLAAGIHLAAIQWLAASFDYLAVRHALVAVCAMLPLAAAGLAHVAELAARRAGRPKRAAAATLVLTAGAVLLTAPWALRRLNPDEAHLVPLAGWIREHTFADEPLIGDRRLQRVALYADRRYLEWPRWGYAYDPRTLSGPLAQLNLSGRSPTSGSSSTSGGSPASSRSPASGSVGSVTLLIDQRRATGRDGRADFFAELERRFGSRLRLRHTVPGPDFAAATQVHVYALDR